MSNKCYFIEQMLAWLKYLVVGCAGLQSLASKRRCTWDVAVCAVVGGPLGSPLSLMRGGETSGLQGRPVRFTETPGSRQTHFSDIFKLLQFP